MPPALPRAPLAAVLACALAACSSSSSSPPACTYAYSDWAACTAGLPQTRTVESTAPAGCAGTPELTRTCPDYLLHVPSPAWEEQVIYFVMPDRFANGDPANDDQGAGEFDPANGAKYSGGDLQGLIDRLDYIQGLGATAVWITPPVANMWWDPLVSYGGYHGYWARDLTRIDEHLGDVDTYQRLADALHRRGMYLIQDVVPNHMGNFFTYAASCGAGHDQSCWSASDPTAGLILNTAAVPTARPTQAPFDQNDPRDAAQRAAAIYHWTPSISDYTDPAQVEGWAISDLDDLDTENEVVRTALKQSYGAWIQRAGVDAFRVDTAKFVPHQFWGDFFHATGAAPGILAQAAATGREDFLAFGEVADSGEVFTDAADLKIASYLGTPAAPELPSVLYFPLYADLGAVFGQVGAPTTALTYRLGKMLDPALYPDPHRLPTFLDNHDVARFLTVGTPAALAQALTFLFTAPGIPTVYYGTEQGFTETRAAMFKGGWGASADRFDTASEGYQRIKKLAALRKAHPVLATGATEVLYDNPAGAGPFAFARRSPTETVLVLLNSSDARMVVSGLQTGLPAGTVLEVLHTEANPPAPRIGAGGRLTMVLPGRAALVARATAEVVEPPPPPATITVETPIEGQVFDADLRIKGTIQPPTANLRMILDGYLDHIANPVVDRITGAWEIDLKVSDLEVGLKPHTLAFYDLADQVGTLTWRFQTNVVFDPVITSVDDPAGDDTGPAGTYLHPSHATFLHQDDVTNLTVLSAATTMKLVFTMRDLTTTWNPKNGFDHVAFSVFFELPGLSGATVLPLLQASAPAGFTWSLWQSTYGWGNVTYRSDGASATQPGALAIAPRIDVDAAGKKVTFTYNKAAYGLASWSGVRIWATTWDIDGISGAYRSLSPAGELYNYGGGAPTDPYVMDAVGPVAIP